MATVENTKCYEKEHPLVFAEGCIKCHLDQPCTKPPNAKSILHIQKVRLLPSQWVLGTNHMCLTQLSTLPLPDSSTETIAITENEI